MLDTMMYSNILQLQVLLDVDASVQRMFGCF